MDEAQKQALLSAVRSALIAIGGFLVGKGIVVLDTWTQIVGGIMAILPAVWGAWDKFRAEEAAKAREVVAVNVGIAVADRTHGVTPPVPPEKTPAVIEAFAPVVPAAVASTATGLAVTPTSPLLPPAKG